MTEQADKLIHRYEALASRRAAWEPHWQDLADFVRPGRGEFNRGEGVGEYHTPDLSFRDRVFDSTPAMAAEGLAAGLWGMITNASNRWFMLKVTDREINEDPEVTAWLDDVVDHMLSSFSANGGQFYSRVFELYADLATFGTGVFYSETVPGSGGAMHFSTRPLGECFIAENHLGQVDTLFRRFSFTARQAVQRFGQEACGATVAKAFETEPDRRFPFLHAALPNEEWSGTRPTLDKKPFASAYLDLTDRSICSQGGYYEFPYDVPRWSTAPGEVYGRSPALLTMPDVKMLNQMCRTTIKSAQKAADPPLLTHDDGTFQPIRTFPGGVTYGGVTADGRPLIRPLVSGARPELGLEMEEQRRRTIRESFYASLMQLVGSPSMTATEVLVRQEERLRLMGPHLGRIQAEFLDPLINRVFNNLQRAGVLPEPPAIMTGHAIDVDYVSPLAQAQKTTDGQAVLRTLEGVTPIMAVDPSIADILDGEEIVRTLREAYGAPNRILRSRDQVEQRRQEAAMAGLGRMLGGAAPAGDVPAGGSEGAQGLTDLLAQLVPSLQAAADSSQAGGDASDVGEALVGELGGGNAERD